MPQNEIAASLARDGFGPDEIAAMCSPTASVADAPDPTPLRWGLNDVMWGDDNSVTVLLSGPGGEPYWLELGPERAAVLRQDLAGPPVDQAALREIAAQAIRDAACTGDCGETEEECRAERIQPFVWRHGVLAVVEGSPEQLADAVLAVLPAPVDRAAVLREAANRIDNEELPPDYVDMFDNGARWAARLLRRVADETAATETQAHEPLRQWRVEILDGDEWMPASGLRRDRSQAAEQLRMSSEQRPLWKDGTQVQRRLVRETTTYSVEAGPAANCLCGVLRTGPGRHLPECPNGTAAGARQDGAQP